MSDNRVEFLRLIADDVATPGHVRAACKDAAYEIEHLRQHLAAAEMTGGLAARTRDGWLAAAHRLEQERDALTARVAQLEAYLTDVCHQIELGGIER